MVSDNVIEGRKISGFYGLCIYHEPEQGFPQLLLRRNLFIFFLRMFVVLIVTFAHRTGAGGAEGEILR